MAFGFPAKHTEYLDLNGIDKDVFFVAALEAATRLGWNISFVSESGFIAYTQFSWSSWSEELKVKFEADTVTIKSECVVGQLVDWGKNRKNIEGLLEEIEEIRSALSPEQLNDKVAELQQRFASPADDILNKPASTSKEKVGNFFSIFKPIEGYFITPILINATVLVFVAMVLSGANLLLPANQDLLDWGANFRPLTLEGESWRLLTSCFLHIGILHLFLNMYALYYIGSLLEPYLGKTRFLAAYSISGISASMTSLYWNSWVISAGASGAIFGMYGVFIALLLSNILDKSVNKALLTSALVFVGYSLLNGLRSKGAIDNAAHIGGLVSGLFIGAAFIPSIRDYKNTIKKISTIAILTVVLVCSSFLVYTRIPNTLVKYEEQMKLFASMEAMALEPLALPEGTPKEKMLSELKDKGIYYWNENKKLIDSFENMDLPLTLRVKNDRLKEYCDIRIKTYELMYRGIEEGTGRYQRQIGDYNRIIEAFITEFEKQKSLR
jgi:rhomboid protease GluP